MSRPAPAITPSRLALFAGFLAFLVAATVFWSFDAPFTLRGDNQAILFPMNLEAYRSWSEGTAPQWTSRLWFGFPLLADPTSMSLYWPNFVGFLATEHPHFRAYDLATAFHAAVLVTGTVWLLGLLGVRRSVCLFGGLLIFLAPMHVWYASSMITGYAPVCWWPLMLVAAEMLARPGPKLRYLVLGWIALGSCACVYPEFAFYGGLVSGGWLVSRSLGTPLLQRIGLAGLLGAGSLALAAPQLLPTVRFLPETTRSENPDDFFEAARVVFDVPALLYPSLDDKIPVFVGIATVLLAVCGLFGNGQRRWFLGGVALLAYVNALGPAGYLYEWIHSLPVFEVFRQPMKFKLLSELGIALLAALGIEHLLRAAPQGAARRFVLLFAALCLAENFVYLAIRVPTGVGLPGNSETTFLDLYETLEESRLPAMVRAVPVGESRRTLDSIRLRAIPLIDGVPLAAGGANSLLSPPQLRALDALPREPGRAALSFLGVRFSIEPVRPATLLDDRPCLRAASDRGLLLAGVGEDFCLFSNPDRPALVEVPERYTRPRDLYEMMDVLLLGLRNAETILAVEETPVECGAPEPVETKALVLVLRHALPEAIPILAPMSRAANQRRAAGRVSQLEHGNGKISFAVASDKPAFALVRESYSAGWSARVDGEPAPVYRAAGPFFAIPIPAGNATVELAYESPGFRTGLWVALGWVSLVVAFVLVRGLLSGGWRAVLPGGPDSASE